MKSREYDACMIHSHRDLIVWQKAMDLVTLVYAMTEKYPKSELYGLINQMRRSAVSIPTNIAEGRKYSTRKEFHRFLGIAYGSAAELETEMLISRRLKFGEEEAIQGAESLLTEIMKMLARMMRTLAS